MEKTNKTLTLMTFWILFTAIGIGSLWAYSNTPGELAQAPMKWPQASHLSHNPELPTLVLSLHPKCSCSQATVSELERLALRVQNKVEIKVLFVKPDPSEENWEKTSLWAAVKRIPNTEAITDNGGRETQIFKAKTSGQALLYDASGRLVFNGGLTPSRGHEGSTTGQEALVKAISFPGEKMKMASVFGCHLFN